MKSPYRPSKYHNQKITIYGHTFASRKEAMYFRKLKILEEKGHITGLQCQVKFDFPINGKPVRFVNSNRVMHYVADFEYFDMYGNRKVVDVKGFKTRDYLIKKALMMACHGILVEEV